MYYNVIHLTNLIKMKKAISIRIEQNILDQLKVIAKQKDRTLSYIINVQLKNSLNKT